MAVALILLLVAIGSVLFHLFSPWWWTPIATDWSYIDHTISITFWITGFVFTAVIAFMAYCVFRFHHKEGRRADYNPETKSLNGGSVSEPASASPPCSHPAWSSGTSS
jgi:cytochrome c oxidase subunit II